MIDLVKSVALDLRAALGMLFTRPLRVLCYLYIMRVPVLTLGIMILFPLLSWLGPLRALTVGAYEVESFAQALLATLGFVLAGGSAYSVASAFAEGVGLRYPGAAYDTSRRALRWWRLAVGVAVLGNICWMLAASWHSVDHTFTALIADPGASWWWLLAGSLVGLLVATLMGGTPWLKARLFHPIVTWLGKMKLGGLTGFLVRGGLLGWLATQVGKTAAGNRLAKFYQFMGASAGVIATVVPGSPVTLEKGQPRAHAYALLTLGALLLVIVTGFLRHALAPVTAIFLLFTVVIYVGTGLTYLLDLYRVPLILTVVAYCTLMTQWRESDHFYAIYPRPKSAIESESGVLALTTTPQQAVQSAELAAQVDPPPDTGPSSTAAPPRVVQGENLYFHKDGNESLGLPAQMLGRHGREHPDTPFVVLSLAGGGIQAAAWPLALLEEIETSLQTADPHSVPFHQQVRMISGVSGGSVGAMYYAHAYSFTSPKGGATSPGASSQGGIPLRAATLAAQSSSLAEVTLAILRDDFRKVAFPFLVRENGGQVLKDRGEALERSFSENAELRFGAGPSLADASLSSWGQDALEAQRPALILNGTVVETGERISFSTVHTSQEPTSGGWVEFSRRYNADIALPTAARLSATFPLVSPAARPAISDHEWKEVNIIPGQENWASFPNGCSLLHVVDGGYYETSGVVGALAWLDEALTQLSSIADYRAPLHLPPPQHQFKMPSRIIFIAMSGFPEPPANTCKDEGKSTAGSVFDAVSPIIAAVGVRQGTQKYYPDALLKIFKSRWDRHASGVRFDYTRILPEIPLEDWNNEPASTSGYLPQAPPLSWHLRASEQAHIAAQMKSDSTRKLIEKVRALINQSPSVPPTSP
ncbi:hypothetical protein [Verrucomicrobium sp. BvORR034]|uniref:hypothetical protein n=1 Tax=Verrucomicrobium sp. BvORR034 TaxID=1396418 RepID=UPI000679D9D4|nr:hypothetical protein [Verrucomicrobium sp. BvORR034]